MYCPGQACLGPDVLDEEATGRALQPRILLQLVLHPLDARWRRLRRLTRPWQRHWRWLLIHRHLPARKPSSELGLCILENALPEQAREGSKSGGTSKGLP